MSEEWRVLIADDEPWIREGIRDAVSWERYRMEVAAEAENGEEAFELALKHSIDLLIVDLNMPTVNGLTLMKKLRQALPLCRFVIVTGYDQFSYAQEAIRLQVDDYLLKPVEPGQLDKVLQNISSSLAAEKKKQRDQLHIQKNLSLLKEHVFQHWVKGQIREEEVCAQLESLRLPPRIPDMLGVVSTGNVSIKPNHVKEKAERFFKEESEAAVVFGDGHLVGVCLWRILTEKEQRAFEEMMKNGLQSGVSSCFINLAEREQTVPEAYQFCREQAARSFRGSPVVARAKEYMQEHFAERDFSLMQTADALQVSSVYLSRMMKRELGMTFVQLLTEMRMQKAVHLLKTTSLPIHDIAEQTGYDTQHYFSTVFKKTIGVTPNQYRRMSGIEQTGRKS
ncbi:MULTISPECIES: response regulator transcription factor [Bacillus]|uniref:Response regulator n=1 Tax=Bacillus glycinifermentans TaxID=1664069 RepID=A0AAJ3YV97_9BACI|nr:MULTISPECIES: response regulator [Bacillus]KKB71521.1 transcriptional regulator [Bacillus sp. TH008]MBU8786024.1 response regulator [Bacillus glycinifermentans]MDU0072210.1 response regulator [Bacillus sp. IG6]MED8019835.1 response regulator [Bacillus glycinifermentans]NUJ15440.1 response regulator [Bacillus glycinifermentans]